MHEVASIGQQRSAALDAVAGLEISGVEGHVLDPEMRAWATEQLAGASLLGLAVTSVPAPWRGILARAGVPFARQGPLTWAQIQEDPALEHPRLHPDHGHLRLPPLPITAALTSLPLRDLRAWVARGTGVRLRLPVGIRLWLGEHRAVLVNLTDAEQAGFLHGPHHGMRAGVTLTPGGFQVLTW